MLVILGTAHGKNVKGKQSPDSAIKEYQWSRTMCSMIKEQLIKEGINCIIDIEDENEKSLTERVNIVNKICKENNNNCIYVSVHINASSSDDKWHNASGWTVWVYEKCSENSKKLALSLFKEAETNRLFGNRWIPNTKYHTSNLYVLKNTSCPAILTENLFQDNKKDVEYLLSDEGKQIICDIHVKGIKNFLGK